MIWSLKLSTILLKIQKKKKFNKLLKQFLTLLFFNLFPKKVCFYALTWQQNMENNGGHSKSNGLMAILQKWQKRMSLMII